jgi:trans-AT polyketide synthase, acyltransferase and oxidoreductase domains
LPTVFMFSGQGSQYQNMGRELFEQDRRFRASIESLNQAIRSITGNSVLERLYPSDGPTADPFDDTIITQPAIYMLEVSLARLLIDEGVRPDYVLGYSLGELAAAAISGMITVEDGIDFVTQQARIFDSRCQQGGMIAVLASPHLYDDIPALRENSELASVNCGDHFTVAGSRSGLDRIEAVLSNRGIVFQRLPVSRGFHSSLIDPAEGEFKALQKGLTLRRPKVPFLSCTAGRLGLATDPYDFWEVVRQPLDVPSAIRHLEQNGATDFVDVGPAGTLANFGKRSASPVSRANFVPILTPFDAANRNLDRVIRCYGRKPLQATHQRGESVAWMFPGQGSQVKGMGGNLFDTFGDITRTADEILGYSIKRLCHEDPRNELNHTRFTQPALYVVNALAYLRASQSGQPDFVLGHSLGEFNALLAAGAFDFATGLQIVQKRGDLMSAVADGGMAAVLNLAAEALADVIHANSLDSVDISSFNAPGQIVIAGPRAELAIAQHKLEQAGATYIPLKVSAPFHSRHMQSARTAFAEYLKGFQFHELKIPVISNTHAAPYPRQSLGSVLEEQITSAVRWADSIRYLLQQGVTCFEEIGPGDVLKNLVPRIRREAPQSTEVQRLVAVAVPRRADVAPHVTLEQRGSGTDQQVARNGAATTPATASARMPEAGVTAETLGAASFRREYNVRYAYMAGAMYKGIASADLVVRMARAKHLAFFGTGGLKLDVIGAAIRRIKRELTGGETFGMNLVCNLGKPDEELETVRLFLAERITTLEAAAFLYVTPALVFYRAIGLTRSAAGMVTASNRVIAKVSRPEVAQHFLEPAPRKILRNLVDGGFITPQQAEMAASAPMADDIAVEADSGGHTDMGVAFVLLPSIKRQRDLVCAQYRYARPVRVGAAGGIGSPEAAAAAFVLGADFIVTGSINQCTPQAGTSDVVKDMLQEMNIQDTGYAPAGDMFEIGARIQVLKRGGFFAARANKLYELWRAHASLEEIPEKTRQDIQEKYFHRTFDEVYAETKAYYQTVAPEEIEKADRNPKHKMALIFRWYFIHTMRLALGGDESHRVDYQVHCGPALGAFNQWVKGTELQNWRNRHVEVIAEKLIHDTAKYLNERMRLLTAAGD